MRAHHLLCTCAVAFAVLVAVPAVAGAVPPQYPNGWTFAPSGLRQIPASVDTRAFCKGPEGTVYEVALGKTTASYASIARIRVSDGKSVKSWTYPATRGGSVVPRAAASDAAGNLYVAVETQTGKKNWVVLKFDRSGRRPVVAVLRQPAGAGHATTTWSSTIAATSSSRERASTPAATTPRSSSGALPAGCSGSA